MDFEDIKYFKAYEVIQEHYEIFNDWDKVKDLQILENLEGFNDEMKINILSRFVHLNQEELTMEKWRKMVDYKRELMEGKQIVKLGKEILNDAKIPTENNSTWKLYKKKLINQNWSFKSIQQIEDISIDVLRRLSMDTTDTGPVKGLVVGNVQSGKTANMAGLMAMAADNGFNYFIILSGLIENLRKQTANRIYNDMKTSGNMLLHWHQIEHPSVKSKSPDHNISKFDLREDSKNRYFTVALKNSSRLTNLIRWLESDKNKANQLKILIIDDEADQASINTQDIYDEDYTKINELIRTLVNSKKFKAMNYVAFTATPYANILNETTEESLYPKDFIYLLEETEDYIGPRQLFSMEEPESEAALPIIRDIQESDVEKIKNLQEGFPYIGLPKSLEQAIHWFIITVAIQRFYNYQKPVSMLIHTSFRVNHHENIATHISNYLLKLRDNFDQYIGDMKILYENETLDFNREHFLASMKDYSTPESVPKFPIWDNILPYIQRIMRLETNKYVSHIPISEEGTPNYHKGFHLVIDNSRSKSNDEIVRLVYPKKNINPTPAFIVIGGNTLSRGLTLEGLTTTYFLRNTKQADTLMQMARWFGYRKGYEVLPRVWMDLKALKRFEFLNQMNEELREEIRSYAATGATPVDYAPKIKNSVNHELIRITSRQKMQSAIPTDFDFSGFNSQTTYFENNKDDLVHNYNLTKDFLNSLKKPEITKNYMIWREIELQTVRTFLENYIVCKDVIKLNQISSLLDWLEEKNVNIHSWNVIYSAVGSIEDTKGKSTDWNINGYSPNPSKRSKLARISSDKIAGIGALRSPSDLLADIKELSDAEKKVVKIPDIQSIRKKYGYDDVCQLIIYRIDRGTDLESKYHKNLSRNRKPLNFSHDIIGINIMIPGVSRSSTYASYISAKPEKQETEEEYYKEK